MTLGELKNEINGLSIEDLADLSDVCLEQAAAMQEQGALSDNSTDEENVETPEEPKDEISEELKDETPKEPATNTPVEKG